MPSNTNGTFRYDANNNNNKKELINITVCNVQKLKVNNSGKRNRLDLYIF